MNYFGQSQEITHLILTKRHHPVLNDSELLDILDEKFY